MPSNSPKSPRSDAPSPTPAANGTILHVGAALSSAVRVGNIGLWQWQVDNDSCFWSPEMYRILRLPEGDGIEPGDRFLSAVINEDRHLVNGLIEALKTTGTYPPTTIRVHGGDGSIRYLVSSGQRAPAQDKDRQVFVGVNIDLTDQAEQKAKLESAEAKAATHAQVIESVLEHVPIGLAVSVDGEIALLSRFASEMIAVPHGGAKQWTDWHIVHLDGQTMAQPEEMALHRAARGEVIRNEEWFIRRVDGSLLPVSCNAGPVQNSAGEVIGGVVAWYDVSQFKAAAAAEKKARIEAEEAARQREVFAAAIAHELRTPLAAIGGWTEILQRSPNSAMLARGIGAISTNTSTLIRLVDDFLDLSRIGAKTLSIVKRPCDLTVAMEAALETVRPIAMGASVVIDAHTPQDAVTVNADPIRLQQAMTNLLSNAVKFSAEGGLVLVTLEQIAEEAIFSVADYGQGIEPADLPLIFDPFFQSGMPTARKGGLGLGLTIARHIVEQHGGELSAYSAGVGCGATFKIRLPLLRLS